MSEIQITGEHVYEYPDGKVIVVLDWALDSVTGHVQHTIGAELLSVYAALCVKAMGETLSLNMYVPRERVQEFIRHMARLVFVVGDADGKNGEGFVLPAGSAS